MTVVTWFYDSELPSDLEVLGTLYPVINQWTAGSGLDYNARKRVAVAVTEAVTNAVIHSHQSGSEPELLVRLGRDGNHLLAEVGDRGVWDAKPPPPPGLEHWEQTGGRGIQLIKQLSASSSFQARPGGGTLVRMTFLVRECAPDAPVAKDGADISGAYAERPDEGGSGMEFRVESFNDVDVMRLSGRIDLVSSNTLKDGIRERLHGQRMFLVLNMERVDFINSSGLGALVSILKDVRLVNGRLVLSNLAPYVQEIFEITQLSNVFEIFATEKDAVASFAGRPTPASAGA